MSFTVEDERFMRRALALARRGVGKTSPNPAVGAVLVRGGKMFCSAKVIVNDLSHSSGASHAR